MYVPKKPGFFSVLEKSWQIEQDFQAFFFQLALGILVTHFLADSGCPKIYFLLFYCISKTRFSSTSCREYYISSLLFIFRYIFIYLWREREIEVKLSKSNHKKIKMRKFKYFAFHNSTYDFVTS